MDFQYAQGATPLDPDEAAGLIPTHIVTQENLNVWEEANILQGARWAARQKKRDLLDEGQSINYWSLECSINYHIKIMSYCS